MVGVTCGLRQCILGRSKGCATRDFGTRYDNELFRVYEGLARCYESP